MLPGYIFTAQRKTAISLAVGKPEFYAQVVIEIPSATMLSCSYYTMRLKYVFLYKIIWVNEW